MYLGTLVNSLLTLFLLVLSGYLIKKINLVSDKTVDELSDVLLKISFFFYCVQGDNKR